MWFRNYNQEKINLKGASKGVCAQMQNGVVNCYL